MLTKSQICDLYPSDMGACSYLHLRSAFTAGQKDVLNDMHKHEETIEYARKYWHEQHNASPREYLQPLFTGSAKCEDKIKNTKTLRDEFAMAAMQGLFVNSDLAYCAPHIAKLAYYYADAMLKERDL